MLIPCMCREPWMEKPPFAFRILTTNSLVAWIKGMTLALSLPGLSCHRHWTRLSGVGLCWPGAPTEPPGITKGHKWITQISAEGGPPSDANCNSKWRPCSNRGCACVQVCVCEPTGRVCVGVWVSVDRQPGLMQGEQKPLLAQHYCWKLSCVITATATA